MYDEDGNEVEYYYSDEDVEYVRAPETPAASISFQFPPNIMENKATAMKQPSVRSAR